MLGGLPPVLLYVLIGAGAAIENVVPPVPADTFVLFGAFLAAAGRANPWLVYVCTLVPNVLSALMTYGLSRKYGRSFFHGRIGGWLLNKKQLETVGRFYDKWGTPAIFVSRFLPAFRAVVPVFAGVTHVSLPRLLIPLALASALWYGILVYFGAMAGRNWQQIMQLFDRVGTALLVVAGVLIGAFLWWWWRTRHRED